MSVYRRHKEKNFTCIDNNLFNDKTLSMKAKGLLAQILSLPDDWKYSVNGLASLFSDGRDAVNGAINELIEHGYITRTRITNEFGTFDGYQYDIYEKPQTESEKIADFPFTGKPFTENPFTENSTQLNTNISNTKVLNTKELDIPPIPPQEQVISKEQIELDSMFKLFWTAYPKKVDRKGCERKFVRIKNLKEIFPDIMQALETQKRSRQWTEENGKYIPHPSTWINQERWNIVNEADEKQARIDEIVASNIDDFLS